MRKPKAKPLCVHCGERIETDGHLIDKSGPTHFSCALTATGWGASESAAVTESIKRRADAMKEGDE